mgnify:FL=1
MKLKISSLSVDQNKSFMSMAMELANKAYSNDEVPVGAVIVQRSTSEVLAAFANQMRKLTCATAHAEMLCIREATSLLGNERLVGCDIYVTLEPCPMCAHAISIARIDRLFFGAEDKKSGGVENGPKIFESSSCHHKPEVHKGIFKDESSGLLKSFFQAKRV